MLSQYNISSPRPNIKPLTYYYTIIISQNFHYRMLGLGAHYKPSKPYDFYSPCDVVQKQIVASRVL